MAHVLVVDDEEGLREFVADALESEGHVAQQAASGEEALLTLRASAFEVLVTDMQMSGMTGLELLRQARSEQPELEVIVLTAHGSVESAVEAMRLGAFDFVQKPVSGPAELRLLVDRALERRQLLTERDHSRRHRSDLPPLTYGDPAMESVVASLRKVAPTDATVLLQGESGTGKELAARSLHEWSRRADGAYVAINCAAVSDSLIESELFGHEKGAFTGATAPRRGRVELAAGGTFFLDEIGELKLELQAKLLRVLQEKEFERVGGSRTIPTDVRWVAATNRDLEARVSAGAFREDLYHRLAVFPVRLPSLEERKGDIVPLARELLGRIAGELGRPDLSLEPEAERFLVERSWPGNVRELSNTLERAAILCETSVLASDDLDSPQRSASQTQQETGPARSLAEVERSAIERALAEVDGNRKRAAELLGIGERTLYEKLKRYDL